MHIWGHKLLNKEINEKDMCYRYYRHALVPVTCSEKLNWKRFTISWYYLQSLLTCFIQLLGVQKRGLDESINRE